MLVQCFVPPSRQQPGRRAETARRSEGGLRWTSSCSSSPFSMATPSSARSLVVHRAQASCLVQAWLGERNPHSPPLPPTLCVVREAG